MEMHRLRAVYPAPTYMNSTINMDPKIWSLLPPELLDHVLSLLPLKTFLNLRSTCKHFNSLLYSPNFISKHSSLSQPSSSFLLLAHPQCNQSFPIYDSALGAWRSLLLRNPAPPSSLISTSHGLLCFSQPNTSSFVVCNLLTKSSRRVKFPAVPFSFELLTFVSTPLGYKIFVIARGSSSQVSVFLYDSRSCCWRQFNGFDRILSINQQGSLFAGCLYFVTPEPFSVVYFDLEAGTFERCDSELPRDLTFARLVSDGEENLYLVGGIGINGISRGLKVWAFERQGDRTGQWVQVESLPELICRKLMSVCYHNYEHVYCFWHQGMICICCYTWPEILYYRAVKGTWHWLPKCPSLPEKWSCGFKWYSFLPEVSALV